MSSPSHCLLCKRIFLDDTALQTEIRHIAAKFGGSQAEHEMNERLQPIHEDERHETETSNAY